MFVLKNAWAALGRVKWRTALTALLALLVSFSAAVDLAVLRADDKANNETYQSQKASAVIRPSAKVTAKRDGADSNYTANYMTWDMYTKYAEAVQKNNLTFEYTLATSVPVRASKSLQAIAAKSDTSEDKTGGNLTLQAFYTNDAAKINDYGTFKVVKGKQLNYKTANDGVLVSQAVAKKNNLKVGDKVTVGNPTKASETYKFTVSGIYEYTGETPARIRFRREIRERQPRERGVHVVHQLRAKRSGCGRHQGLGHPEPQHHLHADRSGHIQQVRATGDKGQAGHVKVHNLIAVA